PPSFGERTIVRSTANTRQSAIRSRFRTGHRLTRPIGPASVVERMAADDDRVAARPGRDDVDRHADQRLEPVEITLRRFRKAVVVAHVLRALAPSRKDLVNRLAFAETLDQRRRRR